MARAGLGSGWQCVFANDIDSQKAESYRANWGNGDFKLGDVQLVGPHDLSGIADLAWASFPCQDLSLAGSYRGLKGTRSGSFWPFWELIRSMVREQRAPRVIVLENVFGALTSHGGADFKEIACALANEKYLFGAMIIDARLFVPQSRPRLFIVAIRDDTSVPCGCTSKVPRMPWHPAAVRKAYDRLPDEIQGRWLWWNPRPPRSRTLEFVDIIEDDPLDVKWHSPSETNYLLSLMNARHKWKVDEARKASESSSRRVVGGIYRRTRNGRQCAEVRFDGLAGCLRTPAGGSSRQHIIVVDGDIVRTRLLSAREAARLMGLPETYVLPERYNQAYQLAGDGVVVPAVRFLAETLLEPLTDIPVAATVRLEAAQ